MGVRPQFMRSNTVTSFGRVISVRGSLARVGLLAPGQLPVTEARATVGRFISIRCAAATTIIAMITEVSCEDTHLRQLHRDARRPDRRNFRRRAHQVQRVVPIIRRSAMP